MGPLALLLWLAEHWWIIAILAVIATGGSMLAGVTSAATILAALLRFVAAVAAFFATPKEQIAGKALLIIATLCVGLWLGHWHGAHQVAVQWAAADRAAKIAADKADSDIAAQADKMAQPAIEKSENLDTANAEARNAYIKQLETQLATRCVANPDALRRLRALR